LQLWRNQTTKKRLYKTLDALKEFGGSGLGEGYRDDLLGMNARADEQRNPARNEGSLAAAGASFDEESALVVG
jgi:hypothetical protein